MPINKNELTKEMIAKAMQCETAEDLVALAKSEGIEITKAEAEAYLAEMDDIELDNAMLKNVAGGYCFTEGTDPDCIEKGMFHP
jgi:hypothetical protein